MADPATIIGISTLGVAVVAIGAIALSKKTRKNRSRTSSSSSKSSRRKIDNSNYDIGTQHFDKKTGEMYRVGPLLLPHEKDKKEDWDDILNSPDINQETKDQILATLGRGKKSSNKKTKKQKKK